MNSDSQTDFAAEAAASPAPAVRQNAPVDARLFISSLAVARQRLATLERFQKLQPVHGNAKSAGMVGSSIVTLWRWQRKFARLGLRGLRPMPASGGRPSPFSKVRLPVAALRELERLMVSTGSPQAAWRQFAAHPLCPPVLARHITTTGKISARLARVARVRPVPAACHVSADGRRLLVYEPSLGVRTVALPARKLKGQTL